MEQVIYKVKPNEFNGETAPKDDALAKLDEAVPCSGELAVAVFD